MSPSIVREECKLVASRGCAQCIRSSATDEVHPAAINDMPARSGVPEPAAADKSCAIHLPDRRRAVVVLPENVRLAVAVKIAAADDMPARSGVPEPAAADKSCAIHLPDRRRAVVVLPENV